MSRSRILARRLLHVAAVAVLTLSLSGAGENAERFNRLGNNLMCMCGCNQILLQCNHVGCSYSDRMRAELTAGLDRGDNDDLIVQAFVQKYGPTVPAAPDSSGFNLVAWLIPPLVLVGGLMLILGVLRMWKQRPAAAPAGVPVALDPYRDRARKETEL